jgi:hypothetical protein
MLPDLRMHAFDHVIHPFRFVPWFGRRIEKNIATISKIFFFSGPIAPMFCAFTVQQKA